MSCTGKHIENPIPDEEWKCPNCGAGIDHFYIDEVAANANSECDLAHPDDVCRCYECGGEWSLKTVIAKWAKKKNMVKCSCCKGTGWVQGGKA